jgi:hypothetical protein
MMDFRYTTDLSSPMLRKLTSLLMLSMLPTLALAHGQEVFETIYAELVTILVIFFALLLVPAFRPYWFGGTVACFGGVIGSWIVTSQMPYRANQTLITAVSVLLPLLATASFCAWRHIHRIR